MQSLYISVTRQAAIVFLSLALPLSACDDDGGAPSPLEGPVKESSAGSQVSSRLCYELEACNCGELAGVSLAGCSTGFGFSWQATSENAADSGLTYDGDCLSRRLNAMLERHCDAAALTGYYPGCAGETCLVFHGDVPEGGDCEGGMSQSNCAQGLVCMGQCQKPCTGPSFPLEQGAACADDTGSLGFCTLGHLCDPDTQTCLPLPPVGSPCLQYQCEAGAFCDTTVTSPICKALIADGQPCTAAQLCASMTCTDGVCTPLPGEGEACLNGYVCAKGFGCDNAVCKPLPGKNQSCLTGGVAMCQEGLACGAKLCSMSGTSSYPECQACADPQTCMARVCIAPPPQVCGDLGGVLF